MNAKIKEAWERFEKVDPDISTERLLQMVMDETGIDDVWQIVKAMKMRGVKNNALPKIDH